MKKIIITLLCLAIVSAGSYGGYRQYKKHKDSKRVVDVVSVSLLAEEGFYGEEESELSAEVTSGSIQRVKTANPDMIKEVKVKPGQQVKKGDVLLVYDTTLAELETEQKKNRINVLKQELADEEKELERLKKLLPSELEPQEPDEPESYDPDEEEEDTYTEEEEPQEDESSEEEDSSSYDDSSSLPEEPAVETKDRLTDKELEKADPKNIIEFNCTTETIIEKGFMEKADELSLHIVLKVYDISSRLIYCWDLDFTADEEHTAEEWSAGDGVTIKDNRVSYDGKNSSGAVFYFETPQEDSSSNTDSSDSSDDSVDDESDEDIEYDDPEEDYTDWEEEPEDEEPPDYFDDEPEEDSVDSENYMYSRAELAVMIKEKEMDIKTKKLDIKAARLEYKNSKKKKDSGVEVAKIDGIVTKVGDERYYPEGEEELGDEEFEDEEIYDETEDGGFIEETAHVTPLEDPFVNVDYSEDEEDEDLYLDEDTDDLVDEDFYDEDYSYDGEDYSDEEYDDMESENESAYIVIQGSANVSVDISVGELDLAKFKEGTEVNGMSYDTGDSFTAVVTGIKSEPASYTTDDYMQNPNSSTYIVTADVTDTTDLSVGSWVSIYMPEDEKDYSKDDGWYIPMQYCRKEGSGYYVMKAGKNGKLKKQTIVTGKTLWGSYLEVKGGISEDDKICFPYGKDVKEGVKTKETDEVLY